MDTSSDYSESKPTPQSETDKIKAVSALVQEQYDDIQPGEGEGDTARQQLETEDDGRDLSEAGHVDQHDSDPDDGISDDSQDAEAPADEAEDAPVTLNRLAEHLELEPADVYELEIPIADGQIATLGQLKDEYKEYGPAKEYQSKLVQERDKFEKQVLATRSELTAMMSVIPEDMRAAMVNAGRQHQEQWEKDQKQAVLEAIPEWQDADQMAKDRAYLVEDGAEYGFSEQEITYTQDARTLRMLRDFSRMKRELQGMRAAAKAQPGKASPPGKAAPKSTNRKRLQQALAKAKADPTIQGKAAVVSQLIRNQ